MSATLADYAPVQARTVRVLMGAEIISGLGTAMGISIGALLAQDITGTAALSGLAQSASVVGGALWAIPATSLMSRYGRRPGIAACYLVGTLGAAGVLGSVLLHSAPLLFVGFFLFGAGSAAKLQSRYAAADLAEPHRRGRQLSLVVWSTTLGSLAGPNLAAPLGRLLEPYGIPLLAGPFAFCALSFVLAATLLTLLLRPDPLLLSTRLASTTPAPGRLAPGGEGAVSGKVQESGTEFEQVPRNSSLEPVASGGSAGGRPRFADVMRAVLASPAARLGMASMALGHLVMVGVMSMTPVHIGATHSGPDTLRLVGLVLSAHIAGMYALAPVVGWLTDRLGRLRVILGGVALLIAAGITAASAGDRTDLITVALVLLGLGWSGTMVGGSTLFAESVPVAVKARAQGVSDLVMGLAAAGSGAVSGVIVELSGYRVLALLAVLATLPLIALALRPSTLAALTPTPATP
ncbi:MFS transporter [Catellatospora sp. KI3]|uniref:MFS transporter n=1 Tax=Catellatospora sp. KI3 TaxID=3041620 RepID=UPI002482AA6A|nr:MFS transporter [Catellatospora sp. KI3]MDI1459382.1 MFS transporter [Catellatospora sp. KI3]